MPYPNEHAARVKNPGFFEDNSFRSKELRDGVRVILGKLKNGNGSMVVQAYRFSADNFTVEQAKKWLEDHKIKFISFEPAKSAPKTGENMNDKIEHSGVLGMRWGIRRSNKSSGGSRRSGSRKNIKPSKDYETYAKLRKKRIEEMSNEEISTVVKRMDLQRRYKDLNPSRVAKGKKNAGSVMSGIGKLAGAAGSIAALAGIGAALYKKVLDNSNIGGEVANALNKAMKYG